MKNEQAQLLAEQTNADANQNKQASSLVNREEIKGTPFFLVQDEERWFIAFAEYRVSEEYKKINAGHITADEAYKTLTDNMWWIIMRMAGIMHEKIAKAAILEAERYDNIE